MQTFRITISRRPAAAGIPGPEDGTYMVSATSPAFAIKRLLDGGVETGYRFASVGKNPLKLGKRQKVGIVVERIT